MDLEKIKQGAKLILEGIGEDPEREGLMDTPDPVSYTHLDVYKRQVTGRMCTVFCGVCLVILILLRK